MFCLPVLGFNKPWDTLLREKILQLTRVLAVTKGVHNRCQQALSHSFVDVTHIFFSLLLSPNFFAMFIAMM